MKYGFLLIVLFFSREVHAQLIYTESFESTSATNTNTLAFGWTQGDYGTSLDPDNYWDRLTAGSLPPCNPHSGNYMMRYRSWFTNSGEASYLASKRLDMRAIPPNGAPFSFWMWRSNWQYVTNTDRIKVFVNTVPNMSGTPMLLTEIATGATELNRSCSLLPTPVTCNGWNQYNYTMPASFNSDNIYVLLVGISDFGTDIYVDDFSITTYPLAQNYLANSANIFVQITSNTAPSQVNQLLIGCKLTTSGAINPRILSRMIFNTNGSTNPATDIANAKLWFTGGTSAFSIENALLLGTYMNPTINDTFLITNSINYSGMSSFSGLEHGDNYFWLTYDIKPGAIPGDYVDAEWKRLTISGAGVITPAVQSLSGKRLIACTVPPSTPGAITAAINAKACPGDTKTFSIVSVAGATSYTWTPPIGSTVISGQGTTSVNVLFNSGFLVSDSIRVVANNTCGISAPSKLNVTRNNPVVPAAISGINYNACNQSGVPYLVTNVAGINYNWSFSSPAASIASGQGTNFITANFGAGYISSTLSVNATNGCGTSANRNLRVYASPGTPVAITGSNSVCANDQNVPYSITPVAGAVDYTWGSPTGSLISDGTITSAGPSLITTSPSVTVDFGTFAGIVRVRANNACGSGSYRTLSVAMPCRTGKFDEEISLEFNITPNPNRGSFMLHYDKLPVTPSTIIIVDALGRIVYEYLSENVMSQQLDLNLATGIYQVVSFNEQGRLIKKDDH